MFKDITPLLGDAEAFRAATRLMTAAFGGEVVGLAFIVALDFLNGQERLKGFDVQALIHY